MKRSKILQLFKIVVTVQLVAILCSAVLVYKSHTDSAEVRLKAEQMAKSNIELVTLCKTQSELYERTITNIQKRVSQDVKNYLSKLDLSSRVKGGSLSPARSTRENKEEKPKLKFHSYSSVAGVDYVYLGHKSYRVGDRIMGKVVVDICPDAVNLGGVYYEVQKDTAHVP